MSQYNKSADEAEKQLNFISKSMCYAKWAQSSMHLTSGKTHSCYHPPLHDIDVGEIEKNPSALHNTKQKKNERKLMLRGERPEGCSYCWKIEDNGNRSDRIYRSGEYWAQNARSDIFESLDTGDVIPRYLEVNFNQACNFNCMYCSPHLSTAWQTDIEKYGPYEIVIEDKKKSHHNDIKYLEKQGLMPIKVSQANNPYLTAFWKWWPSLYRKLEVFRITGGEPLMDVNTFKVLDYIYENPNTWLELSITSNFCPPNEALMEKFIEKVKKLEEIQIWEDKQRFNPGSGNHWYVNPSLKNFALFISVDSVGKQAEYIRNGLEFNTLDNNVTKFLAETNNTTITFINTFNSLSVVGLQSFLEYILSLRKQYSKENQGIKYVPIYDQYHKHPDYEIHPRQRIWFDVPLLRSPSWQAIDVLTDDFEMYLVEAIDFAKKNSNVDNYEGFYDFEIDKLERNLSIFRNSVKDKDKQKIDRINFFKYFDQYDRRNNKEFVETFPEMEKFWKLCKGLV
jgi:organic radical activating enzyme